MSESRNINGSGTASTFFTGWHIAGLVGIFLFVLYPAVILGTHSFFYRDFGFFTYPVAQYSHECFWKGEIPLWNPYNSCGVPFLAQWNTTVCYPLSLIYMIFPLPWSLNLFCLAHLVLAGVGMYFLSLRWTGSKSAAVLAGLVFALNGFTLNAIIWTSNLAALAWQPFVILLVADAWKKGRRQVIHAALAGAMQMLAGAPEIILFTWIMLLTLWGIEVWRGQTAWKPSMQTIFGIVALITALSAMQLLPFMDLMIHSARDPLSQTAGASPMPVWGWLNYVAPLFHCSRTALGHFMQEGQFWTSSYYLGVGTVFFALIGLFQRKDYRHHWWLIAFSFAGLLLALGDNGFVYKWARSIFPWIGFARYPIKFAALPTFTLPLLAACGFETLTRRGISARKVAFSSVGITGALILVALAWTYWKLPPEFWRNTGYNTGMRGIFLVLIFAVTFAMIRFSSRIKTVIWMFLLLLLLGLDVVSAEKHQNPIVKSTVFGPLKSSMPVQPVLGESRAFLSSKTRAFFDRADTPDPFIYYSAIRGVLYQNCNIPDHIPKVDGFSSLYLKEQMEFHDYLYSPTNSLPPQLLRFLSVSQISAADNVFGWQQISNNLPYTTIGQRPIFISKADILPNLTSEKFDPEKVVFLEGSTSGDLPTGEVLQAKILSQEYKAQSIRLSVSAPAPTLAVINQTWSHCWKARVDGVPVPLLRANYSFQAIRVPAGEHVIALDYVDWMFRIGTIISITALILCGVCFIHLRFRD